MVGSIGSIGSAARTFKLHYLYLFRFRAGMRVCECASMCQSINNGDIILAQRSAAARQRRNKAVAKQQSRTKTTITKHQRDDVDNDDSLHKRFRCGSVPATAGCSFGVPRGRRLRRRPSDSGKNDSGDWPNKCSDRKCGGWCCLRNTAVRIGVR